MTNEELWKIVLNDMELSLSRAHFTTWFKNTSVLSQDTNSILVSVPNGFIKEWLENKFKKRILDSIRCIVPEIREVKYVIGVPKLVLKSDFSKTLPNDPLEEKTVFDTSKDVDSTTNLNKKYTYKSYIVGSNNELAHAASISIIKNLGKLYNPLFVYGGVGLGKTHLLQAIGNKIFETYKEIKISYIPADRLTADLLESIRNNTIEQLKNKYSRLDLLVIDDIQFIAGKEKTQDIIFSIFNELYSKNKQVILSSDRPPQAIPALEERLRSRFEGGMIADIGIPDFETRLAILKLKTVEKNYKIEDDLLSYISANIQKNIRELEGALNRVIAFSQIYNKPPNLKEIKGILNTYLNNPYKKTLPQTVLKNVAEFYSLSISDLIKRSRKIEIVKPRQITMFLLREETKLSFPEIGQKLGGRDHSTVIHACEKIKKKESIDEELKQELFLIREKIYNSFDK